MRRGGRGYPAGYPNRRLRRRSDTSAAAQTNVGACVAFASAQVLDRVLQAAHFGPHSPGQQSDYRKVFVGLWYRAQENERVDSPMAFGWITADAGSAISGSA